MLERQEEREPRRTLLITQLMSHNARDRQNQLPSLWTDRLMTIKTAEGATAQRGWGFELKVIGARWICPASSAHISHQVADAPHGSVGAMEGIRVGTFEKKQPPHTSHEPRDPLHPTLTQR